MLPAPPQARMWLESDRRVLLGWNRGKLDLAQPPEVSCWAALCRRRPRKLKFGSNQIVGWLPEWNRGKPGLARAPRVLSGPVLPVPPATSRSAQTRPLGCFRGRIVARSTWRELRGPRGWRPNAAGAPAISGLLELGSNLTGGRCWGEISARSTWRDLQRSRRVRPSCAAGARACSRSDRI